MTTNLSISSSNHSLETAALTSNKMTGDTLEVMIGKEDELLLFDDENGQKGQESKQTAASDQNGNHFLQHQYNSVQLSIDAETDEFSDEPAVKKTANLEVEISLNASGLVDKEAGHVDSLLINETHSTLNSSAAGGGGVDLEISSKLNEEEEEEEEDESADKQDAEVGNGVLETFEGHELGAGEHQNDCHQPHLTSQISADFKYLYRNTRYFVIKSFNYENVNIAKEKSVWSTPRLNEIKLTKAYRECANVLLIFSVAESGRFQGFARLASECEQDPNLQVKWVLPPSLSAKSLLGVFKLDWITKQDLEFNKSQHLLNPWNENKQVKIGRDGQEVEPRVGESLCRLFELAPSGEAQNGETDDTDDAYNEYLASIIAKSKQRHNELASEAENRRRGQTNGEASNTAKEDEEKSSSRESKGSYSRSNGGSSSLANGGQSSSSYRRDYQPPQPQHSGQSFSGSRGGGTSNASGLKKRQYNYDDHSNYNSNPGAYNRGYQAPYGQMPHYHAMGAPNQMATYQQQPSHLANTHQSSYSSSYDHSSSRHRRRSSSPKKRRTSPNYLPVPKEIVLNGTYEDYLAQVRAAQSQQTVGYAQQPGMPYQNPGYPQAYDPYHNAQMGMAPGMYGYGQPVYDACGNQIPQTGPLTTTGGKNKYDEDVEAFLRRTTSGAPSSSEDKDRHRHYDRDRDRDRDRTHRSSKSKDRDRERDRDRRHRSGSRDRSERSTRRRSKDRR